MQVSKGDVLRYVFLPQILPRLNALYRQGFSHLAYMMAMVYRGVNILPANHMILRPDHRRNLSMWEVITAATAELKFTRSNIDKIIIYFLLLIGLFLLVGQVFLTLAFVMVSPSFAMTNPPRNYGDFFDTPNYDQDIAYRLLYSVFGVPDIFRGGAGAGGAADPFHSALQALFQLYSVGLLVIGVIITCYFIFAVVVETAQSGVPFGKRFNHVWAPIRLVVALGLLIPVGYGLNSAQWITLYAAKFGSDFATEGWIRFNNVMTEAFLKNQEERVGVPNAPDMMPLASFMFTVNACIKAYEIAQPDSKVEGYLVRNTGNMKNFVGTSFADARKDFNNGDILIRFGVYDQKKYSSELGSVYPFCGDLLVQSGDASEPGALDIQESYFKLAQDMLGSKYDIKKHAENLVLRNIELAEKRDPNAPMPPADFKQKLPEDLRKDIETAITQAVKKQRESKSWEKNKTEITEFGWAGAGIWFNKIAQINGSMVTAINNIPEARGMPAVMEFIKKKNLMQNVQSTTPYNPNQSSNIEMMFSSTEQAAVGNALAVVDDWWRRENLDQSKEGNQVRSSQNIFIDVINAIFGTRGLFNMCANADVHPLAQLSMLGKGLVEASIRNLFLAIGFGTIGGVLGGFMGTAGGAAAGILTSIATVTISMGFILYYVVPFMPFLYYFFAVGNWVRSIFEAMVGVPLWALAHLRIDGEGLPGDAAMDGYYLILEIFLRPILIVFGLLASVVIFAAMVKVLNEIFSLVVYNLSGHDGTKLSSCNGATPGGGDTAGNTGVMAYFRGPIDEFFFTVVYAIIVYMIGMSCFKLIDLIPNQILRYMNANVPTYSDSQQDPADGLIFRMSYGSTFAMNQMGNIGRGAGGVASGLSDAIMRRGADAPPPGSK